MAQPAQPAHTYNACRFCRQKRSKCDGKKPCDRCQRWEKTCVYDDRRLETKSELRRERDELRNRDRLVSTVLKALQSEDLAEDTLASLWSRTPLEQIASSLGSSSSIGDAVTPFEDSPVGGTISPRPQGAPHDTRLTSFSSSTPTAASHPPESRQSTIVTPIVPSRDDFNRQNQEGPFDGREQSSKIFDPGKAPWRLDGVRHHEVKELLDAFFDWQYIPLFCIDRESLERDFVEGRHEACSPALIRSILCLACRSLGGYEAQHSFHVNLGGRLLQEAKDLLNNSQDASLGLPDAQAFGLLAIHQLGSRDKSDALGLAEECVRVLISLHQEGPRTKLDVSRVSWSSELSTCLQGAISLVRIIRLFFQCLHPPLPLGDPEDAGWLFPNQPTEESILKSARYPVPFWLPSRVAATRTMLRLVLRTPTVAEGASDRDSFSAMLLALTSSVFCFLSTVDDPVTGYSQELFSVYQECLSQYSGLSAAFQSPQFSRTSMLYTHLIYHFSLLSLCRPFCHMPVSDGGVDFRAICLETAQSILSLSTTCHDLILSRQLPVFVPLIVYAAGLVAFELSTFDLAVNFDPQPGPQLLRHDSSRDKETTESSGSAAVRSQTLNTISPSDSFLISPGSDKGKNWDPDQIAASPAVPPVPILGPPGVSEALNCLETMKGVFPVARDAQEHLRQLISGSPSLALSTQDTGYGFP